VPIVIGNDIFVLTQQDIRRIEDIRLMSYNRITQNNTLGPSHYFLDHNLMSEGQCCTLQDLISHCQKQKANASQAEEIQTTCPQLPYSSSASPLRYSCSTSTSDLQ
ncbi:Mst89B, partial [Drosophila busckii]